MRSVEVSPVYSSHPENLQQSISGWPERIGAYAPARVYTHQTFHKPHRSEERAVRVSGHYSPELRRFSPRKDGVRCAAFFLLWLQEVTRNEEKL